MKTGIHPELHDTPVSCSCGQTWVTRSTAREIRVEVCSNCHPYYTGEQRIMDTAGRVERFRRRYQKAADTSQ